MLERGERHPSTAILRRIAAYFGVSTDYLLEGTLTPDEAAKRLGYGPEVIQAAKHAEGFYDAARKAVPPCLRQTAKTVAESPGQLPSNVYPVGEIVRLPIVGVIRAGEPLLAEQNIEGYSWVPAEEVQGGEYFFLRVKGDSMIGARIHDGDLVLIRRQEDVDDGDIAAVLVNDEEATLKRVFRSDGAWFLQPENPQMRPIIVRKQDVRIIGKAVSGRFNL
ncbi:MAG TPA: repressor LexA [Firmicutes bacterium]|nr:repressor LexA [Bacillota bacterium]